MTLCTQAATITQTDGDFSTGWTTTKISDDGIPATGTTTGARIASGGLPGAYRQLTASFTNSGQQLTAINVWSGASYNPSTQGAIQLLRFTWDHFATGNDSNAAQQIFYLIRQGGAEYRSTVGTTPGASWSAFNSGNIGGPGVFCHTTLGCGSGSLSFTGGGPMEFGYMVYFGSNTKTMPFSQTSNVDNFTVEITNVVPEPASCALLLSGLMAGGFAHWRKKTRIHKS